MGNMESLNYELLQAIRENLGYDYIARNYYKFTKEELKDILLECLYVINDTDTLASVVEDIEDRWI